jgi:transposase-like protein
VFDPMVRWCDPFVGLEGSTMGTSNYSDEFKRDAMHQITVRGYPVREVFRRLGSARIRSTSG